MAADITTVPPSFAAGVDVRTVAGRRGHGGGGATTLRVYAAWLAAADKSAAGLLASRLPKPPSSRVPDEVVWDAGKGDIADLVLRPDRMSLDEAPRLTPLGLTESTKFLGFTVVPAGPGS